MPLDPEITHLYTNAREAYEAARGAGHEPEDPAVLDARENYRANPAAYILDLEVNGMSVPQDLLDEMTALDEDGADPAI
jgi:hypothetical protein